MKTLTETLEEFDEKFVASKAGKIYNWKAMALTQCTDVRKFLSQSIKTALESVVMERQTTVWHKKYNADKVYGWNACREELLKNIENFKK